MLFPGGGMGGIAHSWEPLVYQIKGTGLSFSVTKGLVPTSPSFSLRHVCLQVPMLQTLLVIALCSCALPRKGLSSCLFPSKSFPIFRDGSNPTPFRVPSPHCFPLPNPGSVYCTPCSLGDNKLQMRLGWSESRGLLLLGRALEKNQEPRVKMAAWDSPRGVCNSEGTRCCWEIRPNEALR